MEHRSNPRVALRYEESGRPLFLIERNFAEQLEVNRGLVTEVARVNADVGIQWRFSFLSAEKKKTYCLYEAPSAVIVIPSAGFHRD